MTSKGRRTAPSPKETALATTVASSSAYFLIRTPSKTVSHPTAWALNCQLNAWLGSKSEAHLTVRSRYRGIRQSSDTKEKPPTGVSAIKGL